MLIHVYVYTPRSTTIDKPTWHDFLQEGYPKDFVNDTKISIFKLSPLMSSHQVSFAITDLHVQRYETNETQVTLIKLCSP